MYVYLNLKPNIYASNFIINVTVSFVQVSKVVRLHASLPENGVMRRNKYQGIRLKSSLLKEISGVEHWLLFPVLQIQAVMKVLDHLCLVLSSYLIIILKL